MKTVELTETERLDVHRAIVSMMHWHEKQYELMRTVHPTVSKRNKLEADKFKELLNKFE